MASRSVFSYLLLCVCSQPIIAQLCDESLLRAIEKREHDQIAQDLDCASKAAIHLALVKSHASKTWHSLRLIINKGITKDGRLLDPGATRLAKKVVTVINTGTRKDLEALFPSFVSQRHRTRSYGKIMKTLPKQLSVPRTQIHLASDATIVKRDDKGANSFDRVNFFHIYFSVVGPKERVLVVLKIEGAFSIRGEWFIGEEIRLHTSDTF